MGKKAKVKVVIDEKNKMPKDSTEIDDLFSILSSAKKTGVTIADKGAEAKETPAPTITKSKKSYEVTLSELEDLEDEDFPDHQGDEEVVKGTAYDSKKDDIFPAPTASTNFTDTDFFDSRGLRRKTRPLTEDGLPIYSPKELKIGMGGGTDLCPFDCNCCF